ncbi:hypothetical protein B0I37DRAFT_354242 [Chaetomium sp. MPI-CAGE-AT-0009]|nr:hypothetical protein B0I37DRAFT_354242 [Chaetomium sp. MPI-CAGE-AT-0009]
MPRRHARVLNEPASVYDRNERQRRADEDDGLFSGAQFDDAREVCDKLKEERIRAWQSMRAFIETYKKRDFGQLWIALCRDDVGAKNAIRSYFRDYIESSRTYRLSLGEEEYETVQTITTTNTVIEHWKNLVAHADNTVLREKRREDPDNSRLWKLRWDPGEQTDRPVADISNHLAEKYGLIREYELTFKKVETTSDDLLVLLDTLWTRAEDVPCQPECRASLHFTLILAGFGFRPGSVMRIRYKHVRLFVVRDPCRPGERTLAANITVVHDKRHTADPRSEKSGIAHSSISTKAIADNAFATPFGSLDEMLDRPNLEHVDLLELPWKEDMLDRDIFPITYDKYWAAWHQLWQVAGNRDPQRPYSLRVGAGSKLDGPLTPALRSHFMANTEPVFQQRYLPQYIREEIMPIVFGPKAAGTHEELYGMLRRATARRDENAPLYPTVEDMQRLEERRDMQRLKREYEMARDGKGDSHPDTKRAFAAYAKLRSDLRKLVVEHRRVEYFKEADRRRALGQSTSDLSTPTELLSKPPNASRRRLAGRAGIIPPIQLLDSVAQKGAFGRVNMGDISPDAIS